MLRLGREGAREPGVMAEEDVEQVEARALSGRIDSGYYLDSGGSIPAILAYGKRRREAEAKKWALLLKRVAIRPGFTTPCCPAIHGECWWCDADEREPHTTECPRPEVEAAILAVR